MPHLLLIDDDERLASLLVRFFEQHNILLDSATLPSSGLEKLQLKPYDLVILDIMLPEMDGFAVCKEIRKTSNIPIIMLTARGDVMDRVVGLELGADDYLPKPFEPRELVARINNVLRRSAQTPGQDKIFHFGKLVVDTEIRKATHEGKELDLSGLEYQMLILFIHNAGKTISRDDILNSLKGSNVEIFSRSVDILISRLRQKLKPFDGIKTVRGIGYCFVGKTSD